MGFNSLQEVIEDSHISVIFYDGEWRATNGSGVVEEAYSFTSGKEADQFGPTPLIAAMRCYVASKLGEDVDLPEGYK